MRPTEADVKAELRDLLPGADFADAFSLVVDDPALDATTAAHRAMDRPPEWIGGLMWLRDLFVRPLGLVTRHDQALVRTQRIGAFPVLIQTPERVVMGLDDRHLDFRLAVDVTRLDDRRSEVTATTLVKTHNRLGRTYLAVILPFHRWIVPGIMAQVGRRAV
jgi:hypothetical protein